MTEARLTVPRTIVLVGLMGAGAAVAGQNLGAGQPERTAEGIRVASRIGLGIAASVGVFFLHIPRALALADTAFRSGERNVGVLLRLAEAEIRRGTSQIDYVTLADADEIEPLSIESQVGDRALLAVAVFVGTTRLIDNVVLGEDPPIF